MQSKMVLGRWGEDTAIDYLESIGYSVLEKNIRTPYGEIDILALHNDIEVSGQPEKCLVFIEVKTRTSELFGHPETSITSKKQSNLLSAVQYFLQEHLSYDQNWRIDVISIRKRGNNQKPEIVHFINAITNMSFE